MQFEVLRQYNKKKILVLGGLVVLVLVAVFVGLTFAKYRVTNSVTLIQGEVDYTLADLNLVAVYLQDEEGGEEYTLDTEIPESGYTLNTDNSYCEVNNTRNDSISLSYDMSSRTLTVSPMTTRGTKCYLYFDIATTMTVNTVLGDIVVNLDEPNLANTSCTGGSCDEETVGIYEETTSSGTTYYYRGDVENNYLEFAGFYWRIIRINEDGSVRIIYDGDKAYENGNDEDGDNRQIGTSEFNSISSGVYQYSYGVGYMYTVGEQYGTTASSTIKGELDKWYADNLEEKYASYIADSGFCGDRNLSSSTSSWVASGSDVYYAAYERIVTKKTASLECSDADLYTTSTSNKGNQALEYPIGLITVDEVAYAGLGWTGSNTRFYLYTGSSYWTMSPSYFYSAGFASVFYVYSAGYLYSNNVHFTRGVRPVINLATSVEITGSGTIKFAEDGGYEVYDPYVVQTT